MSVRNEPDRAISESGRRSAGQGRAGGQSPILKAEWENLAETCVRLAEQSEGAPNASTYDPIQDMLNRAQPKQKKR